MLKEWRELSESEKNKLNEEIDRANEKYQKDLA